MPQIHLTLEEANSLLASYTEVYQAYKTFAEAMDHKFGLIAERMRLVLQTHMRDDDPEVVPPDSPSPVQEQPQQDC